MSPYSAVIDNGRALPKTDWRFLATVLTAAGDVDASTGDQLARDLLRCAAMEQPVIIDLRMLSFFGIRGVHVLIEFHSRCRERGLLLMLVTNTLVDRLVSLTGTTDVLRSVGSLRSALWRLRGDLVRSGRQSAPLTALTALQC